MRRYLQGLQSHFALNACGALSLGVYLAWQGMESGATRGPGLVALLAGHCALQALAWVAWQGAPMSTQGTRGEGGKLIAMLTWALLFRLALFKLNPALEDDWARYLWDGYQTASTGTPYGPPPAASFGRPEIESTWGRILSQINHPELPTIYGPLLQLGFFCAYLVEPGALWPLRIGLFGFEILCGWFVWRLGGAKPLCFFAWSPLLIKESFLNLHPELPALALLLGAWYVLGHGKVGLAGALWGCALAGRPFALLAWPFLLHRARTADSGRPAWVTLLSFGASAGLAVVAFYVAFAEPGADGGLFSFGVFATQWEFNASVYSLLAYVAGPQTARWICLGAALACIGWIYAQWHSAPRAAPPLDLVYGCFFLLTPVVNAWYLLWLLPFAALRPAAWSLAALALAPAAYATSARLGLPATELYEQPLWLRVGLYGILLIIASWGLLRYFLARKRQYFSP